MKSNIQRIIAVVTVVALLACMLVFPASAYGEYTAADFMDYVEYSAEDAGVYDQLFRLSADPSLCGWYLMVGKETIETASSYGFHTYFADLSDSRIKNTFQVRYRPYGRTYFELDNIPDGSKIIFNLSILAMQLDSISANIAVKPYIRYFDDAGVILTQSLLYPYQSYSIDGFSEDLKLVASTNSSSSSSNQRVSFDIDKPDDAAYFMFYIDILFTDVIYHQDNPEIVFSVTDTSTWLYTFSSDIPGDFTGDSSGDSGSSGNAGSSGNSGSAGGNTGGSTGGDSGNTPGSQPDYTPDIQEVGSFLGVNYRNYTKRERVEGDNDVITLQDDSQYYGWYFMKESVCLDRKYGISSYTTDLSLLDTYANSNFYMQFRPFGQRLFWLANIPDQSSIAYNISVTATELYNSTGASSAVCSVLYYDSRGKKVGSQAIDMASNFFWTSAMREYTWDFTGTITLDIPDDAEFLMIRTVFDMDLMVEAVENPDITFTVSSYSVGLTIPSSYRQQESMDDISGKLDDLVNGTSGQKEQVDSAVGEMQDAVGRLEEAGDAMNSLERPDVGKINISINSLVPQTSLLAYTAPILVFWNNDTLLAMVTIVATLVLVSWVFFGKKE